MARFETWVNRDLKKIMTAEDIRGTVFTLDNLGNLIGVRVFSDGEPVTLSGTVNGYCILADGSTVPVSGYKSENRAWINLPQSAYAVPGMIRIAIKLTEDTTITTLAALIGSVALSRTDNMITPSSQVITDWSQQIAAEMQAVEDASAAQDVKIGYLENALADEAIAEFGTLDIGTLTSGYYIRKSDGAAASSKSGWSYTDYIELHHSTLLITCPETSNSTQLNNVAAMAFYSAGNIDSYISNATVNLISGTSGEFTWIAVNVPSSAKYFRASVPSTISASYKIVGIENIIDFKNESLIQRGIIPGGADINDYTVAGMYVVLSIPSPAIANWPDFTGAARTGRLIVFGNDVDSENMRVQLIVDGSNNAYIRKGNSDNTWSDWKKIATTGDINSLDAKALVQRGNIVGGDDLNTFTTAGQHVILTVPQTPVDNWPDFPEVGRVGRLIVFGNNADAKTMRVQLLVDSYNNAFIRKGSTSAWSEWKKIQTAGEKTVTVGVGKDFSNLVDCLLYYNDTSRIFSFSEDYRLHIKMDAGTFDMNGVVDLYEDYADEHHPATEADNPYHWGLYLPPYSILEGVSSDKTKITMYYTGSDDYVRGHISPINMPYTSEMKNLTISVKNTRYCVHSDGDSPFSNPSKMNGSKISVENVMLEHLGYDDTPPTYNSPSAWGAGIRDGVTREFKDCDFIATMNVPWFCHNTVGQQEESKILFENCRFINKSQTTLSNGAKYEGAAFISWGTDVRTWVSMKNCYTNRCISIRPAITYNPDTTCDYFVYEDGNNFVSENSTNKNDAHLIDTWINRNCIQGVAGVNVSGYNPVTISADGFVGAYSHNAYKKGIAINKGDTGDAVTVQVKGLVDLRRINALGLSVGDQIDWNGSAWVTVQEDPFIIVRAASIGEIVGNTIGL